MIGKQTEGVHSPCNITKPVGTVFSVKIGAVSLSCEGKWDQIQMDICSKGWTAGPDSRIDRDRRQTVLSRPCQGRD